MKKLVALAAIALLAGCGGSSATSLPQGDEPVELDPADFTTDIDNPWMPFRTGSKWVYRETDQEGAEQRVEVTVLDETKMVMGIETRVVHDVVTEDGEVVEATFDWYAQDADGNLWYFGEDTKEFDDGKVSTAGSWEAGVDGAQPGVLVPAEPEVGMTYRQEYYEGEAEDGAVVVSLEEKVEVPFGKYEGVLMTREFNPLEPDVSEHKFYARGIGVVLALQVSGGSDREELLEYTTG
jgi:major membrane immunogen (membrane-anchored lipoprotein)